jgi:hypothetical protein
MSGFPPGKAADATGSAFSAYAGRRVTPEMICQVWLHYSGGFNRSMQ